MDGRNVHEKSTSRVKAIEDRSYFDDRVIDTIIKALNRLDHKFEESMVMYDANLKDDLGVEGSVLEDLVGALSEEFDVQTPDAEFRKWTTIKDIINYLG